MAQKPAQPQQQSQQPRSTKAPLSRESHDTIVTYIKKLVEQFPRAQMSKRFELIDQAYYRKVSNATKKKLEEKVKESTVGKNENNSMQNSKPK